MDALTTLMESEDPDLVPRSTIPPSWVSQHSQLGRAPDSSSFPAPVCTPGPFSLPGNTHGNSSSAPSPQSLRHSCHHTGSRSATSLSGTEVAQGATALGTKQHVITAKPNLGAAPAEHTAQSPAFRWQRRQRESSAQTAYSLAREEGVCVLQGAPTLCACQ